MNRVQVITGFVGYQPPHSSLEPLLSGSVRPVLKFNRLLEVYGQDHWSDPSSSRMCRSDADVDQDPNLRAP